jgi:hypothetical protein
MNEFNNHAMSDLTQLTLLPHTLSPEQKYLNFYNLITSRNKSSTPKHRKEVRPQQEELL